MLIIPVTLTMVAIAALINFWLAYRIGQLRSSEKISVGHGDSDALLRRMRAQLNFAEYTPITLILILALELSGGLTNALWLAGGIYMLGRIAHGLGMDGGKWGQARTIGIGITMIVILSLTAYALWLLYTGYVGMAEAPVTTA